MITTDRISRALGDAVVRMWAGLPHDLQSRLFDEVVSENEDMKPDLALLLHEQHPHKSRQTVTRYYRARFIGRLSGLCLEWRDGAVHLWANGPLIPILFPLRAHPSPRYNCLPLSQ
jgi:hypothetical protein